MQAFLAIEWTCQAKSSEFKNVRFANGAHNFNNAYRYKRVYLKVPPEPFDLPGKQASYVYVYVNTIVVRVQCPPQRGMVQLENLLASL